MQNKELIYEMARRLDMVIEVWKKGVYYGKYRFINGQLYKLKENNYENSNGNGISKD